jgi:hypothetical protein
VKAFRARPKGRSSIILAVAAIVLLAGCDPLVVMSVNGLVGEGDHAEPFDAKYVGDWFDSEWERQVWKIERLMERWCPRSVEPW